MDLSENLRQQRLIFDDAADLVYQLHRQEAGIRLRCAGVSAPVGVPEAPVHKDHVLVLRQNEIRSARQVFSVRAEPVPGFVQHFAHGQLGGGVSPLDTRHVQERFIGGFLSLKSACTPRIYCVKN